MASSTVARSAKMAASLSLLVLGRGVAVASADTASIYSMPQLESWAEASLMLLAIAMPDNSRRQAQVLPLTSSLGLNQTSLSRSSINIQGIMVAADASNYVSLVDPNTVAYLSCDNANTSNMDADLMINTLMQNKPKAILLYSVRGNCCGLQGSNLPYQSIFTMTNANDSAETLRLADSGASPVGATITGNVSSFDDGPGPGPVNNSAVAMSILYSITGLITLLFLVIIATGAIRAHRYPERYGPRAGHGGRPRQSRAKGLARAVLETLPIVKFGDPTPAKPDPAHELVPTTRSHDATEPVRPTAKPDDLEARGVLATSEPQPHAREPAAGLAEASSSSTADPPSQPPADDRLGCSICTEDFFVGEDVRVLPCDHKFHPPCIDPWLINVSGTCPLCRLDLRAQAQEDGEATAEYHPQQLPPPLEVDGNESGEESASRPGPAAGTTAEPQGPSSSARTSRRASRLLDLHRLRHATVEERIEILRRHRSQQQQQQQQQASSSAQPAAAAVVADGGDPEERGRRARLADKLRETFRIRTRPQEPSHMVSGAT